MQNVNSNNGVTFALVGSSGAGKSTLLREVFLEDVFGLRKDKDYIITIFTESPDSDAFKKLNKEVKVDGYGLDEEQINWAYRMNLLHGKQFNFLYILDDVLQLRYQKQLERMFLIMRNTNISSVVSIQYPNLIPRPIRTSVYYIFCMRFNTQEGVEMAVDYFLSSYIPGNSKEEKMSIYMQWAENHRFYLIDNLNYKTYAIDNNYMAKELPRLIFDQVIYTPPASWEHNLTKGIEIQKFIEPPEPHESSDEGLSASDIENDDPIESFIPPKRKRKPIVQPFIQNVPQKKRKTNKKTTPRKAQKKA